MAFDPMSGSEPPQRSKDSFIVYTTSAVYICQKNQQHNDLLLKLCADRSLPHWIVGDLSRALDEDSADLFHIAGDRAHALNKIDDAFHMYKFSSATVAKTLRQLLSFPLSCIPIFFI